MTPSDLVTFAHELGVDTKAFIAEYVAKAIGGLADRLTDLEQKMLSVTNGEPGPPGEPGIPGRDGRDAEPVDLDRLALKAADLIPRPKDGRDGRDGRDVDVLALKAEIIAAVTAVNIGGLVQDAVAKHMAVIQIPTLPDVPALVDAAMTKAIATMPVPKDGRDGLDGKDGQPGVDGKDGIDGTDGRDGKDGIDGVNGVDGANGKDGSDGTSIDPSIVDVMVAAQVERAVKALPPAKDGRDGADGKDGTSVTVADIDPLIVDRVQKAVAAIEVKDGRDGVDGKDGQAGLDGKDGRDGVDGKDGQVGIDGKDGRDGIDGKDGTSGVDGKDGLHGKDGVGVTDALLNRDGHLILTLSDGGTKDVGLVVGRDVDMDEIARRVDVTVKALVDAFPRPQDGKDGKDGISFDQSELVIDQTKGVILRLSNDERSVDLPLGSPFDAGTYRLGEFYPKGSCVNAKGLWIAMTDTRDKPGESKAWRLLIRNGRDGRDLTREG
jgi:hypothetical protein